MEPEKKIELIIVGKVLIPCRDSLFMEHVQLAHAKRKRAF